MKYLVAIFVWTSLVSSVSAQDTPHVQATLISNVASVAAGKPFKIGVQFKIDPGWHIYWINPGDSGLTTRVVPDLPTGYSAGPLEYPTPERIVLAGNVVNFAYTGDVVLAMTITPPATLTAGGDVSIPVKAKWLVCQDDCIPGSTDLSITLPVGDGKASLESTIFEETAKKLPPEAGKSADVASVKSSYDPAKSLQASVIIDWKNTAPSDVQLAPEPIDDWEIDAVKIETSGTKTTVNFTLKKAGKAVPPGNLSALLLYKNSAGDPVGVRVGFGPVSPATK